MDIKALLRIAGFSQNGRSRIIKLSGEEISALCKSSPNVDELWLAYMYELQTLLSKMDHARKIDPCLGRPYLTAELACIVSKLACLKYLEKNEFPSMWAPYFNQFLVKPDWYIHSHKRLIEIGESFQQQNGQSILIQSAVHLLEMYRDELLMPPRLRTRQNFDEFDLHDIEAGNCSWMDDGGRAYLEDIRDIPLVTHYDELPKFDLVLDWFIATKPALDNNQVKRGWDCLEKSSEEWHRLGGTYGLSEEQLYEYPSWNCAVADRQEEWLSVIPPCNVYRLVPLITPDQLLEETKSMHHCVVTYLDDCVFGYAKIFSVRDSISDQLIATVELANHSGLWRVAQLKGNYNQELIHRTYVADDPLAIILDVLVNWYNKVAGGKI